ncbi:MAG: hypothetical protein RBR35_08755 [Salinivirgaceae bacterium]|nr:hypothetical protein [Salinivirgaceae bacterium]MDY0280637.1 hypothetical protein [Salinivirgaceae bacterium]
MFKKITKPQHILDIITYDLSTFFYEDDYEEVYSEEILDTFLIDYQKKLPWKEFGIFDRVIFRVFTEKSNLTGTNHINVTFHSEELTVPQDKAMLLLADLEDIYGGDDNRRGLWQEEEKVKTENGKIIRMWTLGEEENVYSVRLRYIKGNGMELQIMFYTNLLKILGKL